MILETPTRTTTVTPPRRVTDSISSEEPEDEVTTTPKCNHPGKPVLNYHNSNI